MVKNSKRKTSDDSGAIVSDNDSLIGSNSANTKTTAPALRSVNEEVETADNLQCEDPYEDIYEEEDDDISYEDVYESSGDEDDEYMEAMNEGDTSAAAAVAAGTTKEPKLPPPINANDGELQPAQIKTWNPFMGNTTGEELEMDETAYKMHHALTPEWPSLTLDIVPDAHLGENRTRFPHTVTMVVGTQADKRSKNKLSVLRMSDLCRIPGSGREKTEKELDDEMLGDAWKHEDDDSDSSSSDEEDEEEELDPVLENYSFSHSGGGINRIRVCPHNSSVVGVWGENGEVSLYDIGGAIDLLDRSSLSSNARKNDGSLAIKKEVRKMRKDPFFVYSGHSTEGYAIDWSRVTPGRLATADCDGNIHIWNATHPVTPNDIVAKYGNKSQSSPWSNSSFQVEPMYAAHGDNLDHPSVEDLQWSPTEATVLASAECGGYVRIYDIRCPGKAMISNKIHSGGADVNVISWNKLVGNLLATGGDDGSFSVFDLRNFQTADASIPPKPLARFHSHRTPITSLEWHPTDESMIAVSDDNGTYVYDLSIEEDDPENKMNEEEAAVEGVIPPQLLFVHSGSDMTKEASWSTTPSVVILASKPPINATFYPSAAITLLSLVQTSISGSI
eukprot:scaffold893_cov154-Skeletonema_menzelii.AAC.14